MHTYQLNYPIESQVVETQGIVLVLGFFDGVHLGHRQLLETGKKVATEKGLKLAVMTMNAHPSQIYGPTDVSVPLLTTTAEKTELMAQLGVDILYIGNFNGPLAKVQPQDFVDEVLSQLNVKAVVAGFDYTFGKKEVANMSLLKQLAKDKFEVYEVPSYNQDGQKVSSTRIRHLIEQGDVDQANTLLNSIYQTSGKVIHGFKRGRQLGFPTANIDSNAKKVGLASGAYTVKLKVHGQWYQGMASVGYNITFDDVKDLSVEVNIFDFDEDIYDEMVEVKWYHYLRPEEKYSSIEALIDQLNQDEIDSRAYFKALEK
ncbi:riboflavin biosynthesis protein RibF [Holzapfeliella sp. He02]|uniref:Riboflavin biosynthesis protein n=1 Tax=Holzapfeliella saturejae TaxID=3082953 RepID=A0ABU8SGL8_9LACO